MKLSSRGSVGMCACRQSWKPCRLPAAAIEGSRTRDIGSATPAYPRPSAVFFRENVRTTWPISCVPLVQLEANWLEPFLEEAVEHSPANPNRRYHCILSLDQQPRAGALAEQHGLWHLRVIGADDDKTRRRCRRTAERAPGAPAASVRIALRPQPAPTASAFLSVGVASRDLPLAFGAVRARTAGSCAGCKMTFFGGGGTVAALAPLWVCMGPDQKRARAEARGPDQPRGPGARNRRRLGLVRRNERS